MPHETLISTIVAGIGLAFLFGALANHIRLSPIFGYLLAGVVIGPFTPGFVADVTIARQLAEVGVILLMFGIGLHFSLEELLSVRSVAVSGALAQMLIVSLLGVGTARLIGWSFPAAVVFGLATSVASTVVVLRHLQTSRFLETDQGRITVGWLVVQDLVAILALVLLPLMAEMTGGRSSTQSGSLVSWLGHNSAWSTVGLTLAKIVAFLALMLLVGRRVIPWILHYVAHTGSRELFRLGVLAIALVAAFLSAELFGVSFALGAFFAGIVLAESQLSQQAARDILPLRDAFAVLFFVSVGMLFDPSILIREPLWLLATVAIIVLGNAVTVFAILCLLGQPTSSAANLAVNLSQIGEFSFILSGLGITLNILPDTGHDLILAGAMLSILLNPLTRVAVDNFESSVSRADELAAGSDHQAAVPTSLSEHAVLVGYGRVGRLIGEAMDVHGHPYIVMEDNRDIVDELQARGQPALAGNSMQPWLLKRTNLAQAKWFISAIPNAFESGNLIEKARSTNPRLRIIARAHSDEEVAYLKQCGADFVIMGEEEIARRITERLTDETVRQSSDADPG